MDLRTFLAQLDNSGELIHIAEPCAPEFAVAQAIAQHDGTPLLFENLPGFPQWRIAAGYVAQRAHFARAVGCSVAELVTRMAAAAAHPRPIPPTTTAPCQEIIEAEVDLTRIPIPRYHPLDGGPYITAGVTVIQDPDYGRNLCFHRLMRLGKDRLVGRIVEQRGTHTAWLKAPDGLPLAVCIGVPPHILLAAAMSPAKGVDELQIAQALAPSGTVRALTVPLDIPADAELVLEGVLTHEFAAEGPFPDLTGTMDHVRQQPVFRVTAITRRRDPIFHALLPAGLEHKNLMGMPREPTIFAEVNKVVKCTGVSITPGGCSWLHAVVQIEKAGPDDGTHAIAAAFQGHTSLKHVVVVDTDVNLYDPAEVEWAIATRFQANRDLILFPDRPSSSLDPSARQAPGQKARTAKMGLDATIPWGDDKQGYLRVKYE
ncbi:MAG TPA: UbiD family decarboxylase [Anaerolineae bacterium]|nr:UbiD family decarboxylase [Anaerolineae bacterium]